MGGGDRLSGSGVPRRVNSGGVFYFRWLKTMRVWGRLRVKNPRSLSRSKIALVEHILDEEPT